MERAADPGEEGKRLCIELIQQIRAIAGVSGVHVMAYRREHLVSEIIAQSGVREGARRTDRRQRCARYSAAT